MTSPPKRKSPAPTKEQGTLRDNQTHTDFTGAGVSPQVADGGNPFARFKAVWSARVTPAGRKLVLLAMTDFANADGTNIYMSVARVAKHCSIDAKQARRHIHDLVGMGVIVPTSTPDRATHTYRLDFPALAALRSTPPEGSITTPPEGSSKKGHLLPWKTLSTPVEGSLPGYTRVNNPPGGGVGSGPGFAGPKGADAALWDRWVRNRSEADRLDLVERGNELSASGHNLDRLVKQAIDNNWRNWPRVEGVKVIASKLGSAKTREDYLKRRAT